MQFGEKIRKLRKENKLSQQELAKLVGVSLRTITSYEKGTSYPRYRKVYEALAGVFHTSVDYLRTESEEFMEEVGQKYGTRGQKQAENILAQVEGLFAGGELSETDQIAFLTQVQQLYLDSKERARKFTPKKYQKDKE